MINIKIKVDTKFINKWPTLMVNGAKEGLNTYLKNLVKYSKNVFGMSGAVNSRSGTLRRSIKKSIITESGDILEGSVGSDVIYAPIHEFGAVITAKAGKYLVFEGRWGDGSYVFKKSVTIPKRPFLQRALDMTIRQNEGINTIQEAIIRSLNK